MNQNTNINLPRAFAERMKKQLGPEADAFFSSYAETPKRGLRVNPAKIDDICFLQKIPFKLSSIPWAEHGFYYENTEHPARHSYYRGGLYYLQEPSAMTPADRLPVFPGERVLDLCAAPGGKATQLAGKLGGTGLLVANEISNARAKALLRNLELAGAVSYIVTNETSARLKAAFPEYFDKILLDAPCSGEGMFRRRPDVADAWSEEKVIQLSSVQKELISDAAAMLRPGGLLMYSTCTFSETENEDVIRYALENHPELHLIPIRPYEGFAEGSIPHTVRIWPHKMEGEGHFMALLEKAAPEDKQAAEKAPLKQNKKNRKNKSGRERRNRGSREEISTVWFDAFLRELGITLPDGQTERRGDRMYLVPQFPEEVRGLHFLRSGIYLGDLKKNRFEPSQPFALSLNTERCRKTIRLKSTGPEMEAYLRGESIELPEDAPGQKPSGWVLVCADEWPVGWGKLTGTVLKNKIPAAWRAGES